MATHPNSISEAVAKEEERGTSTVCGQLFKHTFDAILLTRPDGSILAANPAACRLFGRSEDELIALGRGGVVDGSDPRLAAALEERARNGFATAELTLVRADGSRFTGDVSSSIFRDDNGCEMTSMIIRDVTARGKVMEALRLSESRFRTALDSLTNIAIQGYGPDGTIHYWNRANESFYGYTEAEALGRNLLDLIIPPEMHDEMRSAIRRSVESDETPPAAELLLVRKDGSRVPVLSNQTIVRIPGREPELFCLDVDISRRRRAEKALQESEERFRLAMEATSDGLWDWDVEAGTGYFSPGCYRMLGFEPDGVAMTIPIWLDFIHPDDRDRTVRAKDACIENRSDSFAATFRMKHASGRWVWVLGRGMAVRRDAGGKALRLLGTHVDITERKAAEEQLAASQSRYQSLFEHSSTAVWEGDFSAVKSCLEEIRDAGEEVRTYLERHPEAVVRCAGLVKILDVNLESLDLLKVSRKEKLIRSLSSYFTEESLPVFREALLALAEGETSFVGELPIRNRLGERLHIHMRLRVIPGYEQTLSNVHVSFIDISERKNVEQKLQQLNDELEKRVRERTGELESSIREMESFCHSVSHELRAPIARVEGFCQLLTECLDHDDPKGVRHCAERLGFSSQRIRGVIDALLSIYRLGLADMTVEPVDLSDIARQTMDEIAERYTARRFRVSIAPDVTARGDRRMLGICLQNLLENAVKFTGKTVEPAIEFGVIASPDDRVYFVRDNGAGFDMAFANKLFLPFSRLHNDEEFAGSGIGLATVQRIVERHGGQVWAEASPGKGATIYFTLGSQ